MEKDNRTLMIVSIFALITLIVSATYAYFESSIITNGVSNINIVTPKTPIFTAKRGNSIEFNVTDDILSNPSNVAAINSNGTIEVDFSANNDAAAYCTYDIDFVWSTTDTYTTSDVTLPYEGGYNYELSIEGSRTTTGDTTGHSYTSKDISETDLSSFTWTVDSNSKTKTTLVDDAEIYSGATSYSKTVWTFTVRFYTLPVPQDNLYSKTFGAYLQVSDVKC